MRKKVIVMTADGTVLRDAEIQHIEFNCIRLLWLERSEYISDGNWKRAVIGDLTIYMIVRFI